MKFDVSRRLDDLKPLTNACYLVGSAAACPDNIEVGRDVDLVIVVDGLDAKNRAATSMRRIQAVSPFLFHPTFLTSGQFRRNPLFADLIRRGTRLW